MTAQTVSEGFRIRGWHVLAGMIAFFGIITAVNAYMIVKALETFPGEVSVTPYEDGIAYNKKLAQMSAQAQLGWKAGAAVEDGQLVVRLVDAKGAPVTGLKVTAKMERPATETGRINPRFQEVEPGVYRSRPGASSGGWDVTFQARDAQGRLFEGERRLMWP